MLKGILSAANYMFNPWALPVFTVGLLVLAEGLFVYFKGKTRLVNRIYFFWLISVVLWLWGFGLVQVSRSPVTALFWYRHVALLGVAFISYGSYLFSLSWLVSDFSGRKASLTLFFLLFLGFYAGSFLGDHFVKEMRLYFWGYYPFFGILGRCFLFIWTGFFLATLRNLFLAHKKSEGLRKRHVLYLIFIIPVAYVGAVDFIPIVFGTRLYPFGYIPVFITVTYMGYIIIRYRFMEIDTVIHRTVLWLLTSGLVLIPIGVLLYFIRPWLNSLSLSQLTVAVTAFFFCYLYYYHRIQPRIDHLFRHRKYDYQTILGKVAEKIAATLDIRELTGHLLTEICEAMYLRNSLLYVLDKSGAQFVLAGRRGYAEADGVRQHAVLEIIPAEKKMSPVEGQGILDGRSPLFPWLREQREIIEKDIVDADPQFEGIRPEVLPWFRENELELLIPLVYEDKVLAILGLGRKESLRPYTIKDLELLRKLGNEAGVTLFNALHHEDLIEKERLDEEMKMGQKIQMGLLPRQAPLIRNLVIEGFMQPAREIGGDYYDFIPLLNKDLAIVIGDVSGKGVAAGLLMAMTKTAIHIFSKAGQSPRNILMNINDLISQSAYGEKFMTMLYLVWQTERSTLTYSSAGHENILVFRCGPKEVEVIPSGGTLLGIMPDIMSHLEEKQISLKSRDKILLYTDGVTEAHNREKDRYGLERLKDAFRKNGHKEVGEILADLKTEVYQFIADAPQYDDITLVILEARQEGET